MSSRSTTTADGSGRTSRPASSRGVVAAVAAAWALVLLAGRASAHTGSLSPTREPVSVPFWLFLLTGGGIVGASFLLTSFMTDREFVLERHRWVRTLTVPLTTRTAGRRVLQAVGVAGLLAVLVVGTVGPPEPLSNLATLLVWVVWWAGYPMSVYLLYPSWPALDPWRTVARALPRVGDRTLPPGLGAWPSVGGLLVLVWIEVVTPLSQSPFLLALVVAGYSAVTLAGAAVYGVEPWFRSVDPVAGVFRAYGRLAPFQPSGGGVELRSPGGAAGETAWDRPGEVAFVVALLWVTTFDGFVATPGWATMVRPVVAAGVPPLLAYVVAYLGGFGLFLGLFVVASRAVRRTGDSYVATRTIATRFAPSLLPIAAGYHFAHFVGYFLSLFPAALAALSAPFSGVGAAPVLSVPAWVGGLAITFVLVGHLLAVWVAHGVSFELFTGRLQPIRSQYPYVVAMVLYTMLSLWIIVQPSGAPPYL